MPWHPLTTIDIGYAYNPHAVYADPGDHILVRAPDGTLYAIYHEYANTGTAHDGYPKGHWGKVFLASSIDGGLTWSVQTIIDMQWHPDYVSTSCHIGEGLGSVPYPQLAMRSTGQVVIVFVRSVKGAFLGNDPWGSPCYAFDNYLCYWDGALHDISPVGIKVVISCCMVDASDKLCLTNTPNIFRIVEDAVIEAVPADGATALYDITFCIDENGDFHFFYGRFITLPDQRLSYAKRTAAGVWSSPIDLLAFNDHVSRTSCSLYDSQHMAVYWWEYGGPGRTYIYESGAWAQLDANSYWETLAHDKVGNLLACGGSGATNKYRARFPDGSEEEGPTPGITQPLLMWEPYPAVSKPCVPDELEIIAVGWERSHYTDLFKFEHGAPILPPAIPFVINRAYALGRYEL